MKGSNLGLFILSLVLAVFFWSLVNGPGIARKVTVPVRLEGVPPAGFDVRLHPDDVNVTMTLHGPANTMRYLPRESVKASVDLSEIRTDRATVQVPARIDIPAGIRMATKPRVTLLVTRLVTRTMPVTLSFITVPKPGTTVGAYQCNPETVTLEAASSDTLDRVKYVTVAVDPHAVLLAPRQAVPHAVDADGEILSTVHVLTRTVAVSALPRVPSPTP